jgi:hypothetical protein
MFLNRSTTGPARQTFVRPALDGKQVFVVGWGVAEHSFERRQTVVAVAHPIPHDQERPGYPGLALVPDDAARGRRVAGPAGAQPGPARRDQPASPPEGVFWRRRVLAVAGIALGIWLTAAAVGGLSTALRGLESRPLAAPGLAGAGQATGLVAAPVAGPVVAPLRAGQVYVVQPGETLWDIARRLQPSGDVRPLVDRLAKAAGRAPLQIGQRLVLP